MEDCADRRRVGARSGHGACRHGGDSKQIAALDSAYKAGVISKSEYDAKKAALVNLAASLGALDKARDAGLLTSAEYQERKQRLTAAASAAMAPTSAAADVKPASSAVTPTPVAMPAAVSARRTSSTPT